VENPSTLALDYHLEGCGNGFPFGDCKGRGWLVFDMPINVTTYNQTPLPKFPFDTGVNLTRNNSYLIPYGYPLPNGAKNIQWNYSVKVVKRFGTDDLVFHETTTTLSNVMPTANGISASMSSGTLVVSMTDQGK
jgi:hypothetical protein